MADTPKSAAIAVAVIAALSTIIAAYLTSHPRPKPNDEQQLGTSPMAGTHSAVPESGHAADLPSMQDRSVGPKPTLGAWTAHASSNSAGPVITGTVEYQMPSQGAKMRVCAMRTIDDGRLAGTWDAKLRDGSGAFQFTLPLSADRISTGQEVRLTACIVDAAVSGQCAQQEDANDTYTCSHYSFNF